MTLTLFGARFSRVPLARLFAALVFSVWAAGMLGAPGPAAAQSGAAWRVLPAESRITFAYRVDGAPGDGRFERFSASGVFDPQRLRRTQLTLEIDMDSVDFGSAVITGIAKGPTWFDVERHRRARFELEALTPRGGDAFDAIGALTIRGVTQTLTVPLTLTVLGDAATASGRVSFDRRDFGVGDAAAGLFVEIDPVIEVSFTLSARR